MNKRESGCFLLLAVPFVVVVGAIVNGFVLAVMWGWFIVPALHVGSITIPEAIGLSMVVGFLTHQGGSGKQDENKNKDALTWVVTEALLVVILTPLVVLSCAFVVHLFV